MTFAALRRMIRSKVAPDTTTILSLVVRDEQPCTVLTVQLDVRPSWDSGLSGYFLTAKSIAGLARLFDETLGDNNCIDIPRQQWCNATSATRERS